MRLPKNWLWIFFLFPVLFLNSENVFGNVPDDETPEITARVARISFLRGDVQIRHADSRDWERATSNLPIVEGDEISADSNSRVEIQFDSRNYLRLAENAYLKVTTLRDEGIALSLPNGSLSLRVLEFDKDRGYFEIDAPQTTVSVQKAGNYRIDAGGKNDKQVRVTVTDDGQARIYSESSGFILRSGRSAQIYLDGANAGEWETTDASRYADNFDSWALERDTTIAKRLRDADYDKYYDRDIYGAEELSDYGDWVSTKQYGYVWKPYRSATAGYSDWSPYRYGQWRWIPPYGWTWVNDEPWGWATYHHGRWIYDNGGWYWSPYGQNRGRRSWWSPALVVISYVGNNICWYPLPYNRRYYDYNHRRNHTTIINNNTIIINPTPTPNSDANRREFHREPPVIEVPPTGVIAVDAKKFGRGKDDFWSAPPQLATDVLSKSPSDINNLPILPSRLDSRDKPDLERTEPQVKTGATDRKAGVSMDDKLRKERIYGNRSPIDKSPPNESKEKEEVITERRDTGAIKREPRPIIRQDNNNSDIRKSPPRETPSEDVPVRSTDRKPDIERNDRTDRKTRENNENREKPPPSYSPPQKHDREEPPQSYSPPNKRAQEESPRDQPPPRSESPKPPEHKPEPSPPNESKEKPNRKDG